jgi:hypothetical protein
MYVCILSHEGEIVYHDNMPAGPEPFLEAIAPFRQDLVVGVECILTWYGLADLCRREGIEFVLGHALYNTNSQYNLPEFGKKIARKMHREGIAALFPSAGRPERLSSCHQPFNHFLALLRQVVLFPLPHARPGTRHAPDHSPGDEL